MINLYKNYLNSLEALAKYRKLPSLSQVRGDGVIDFSSNDYLGLSKNPILLNESIEAAKRFGSGATGSRLLSGNNELFEIFEARIAQDKKTEAALIFNSGFQANLSVLSALIDSKVLGVKPLVFFDRLNHNSLYQAIFLKNPDLIRFRHNDMDQLSTLLEKYKDDSRPKFIVTETVFGMDGDFAPLETIAALTRKHNAFLYLDEAHATGLYGPEGYGLSTTAHMTDIPHVVMGTFSKALGGSGAYIACSQILKDYIINTAPGFIYATANSPLSIGAAYKAWQIVKDMNAERSHLFRLSQNLKDLLKSGGYEIGNSESNIIPIILKEERLCFTTRERLLKDGINVSCVRPPTVPPNSSRLRLAITASHTEKDIGFFYEKLRAI